MTVAFNDLQRHYRSMAADLDAATRRVLHSGWYVLGPEVTAFEQAWAAYCGVAHCVSVASGTDALILALRALELQPDDEVLTVANAGSYTTFATHTIGATARYVDVDSDSYTLDPALLSAQITPHTKAIVPVHLYGRIADIEAIMAIAADHGVPVIEDCAQAHGARLHDRHVGTWGVLGCFSFYPTKNLGALGDGGAIITNDAALAQRLRQLRTYGWSHKYHTTLAGGTNSRLDELQAAILQVKLEHLDEQNARRHAIAARYMAGLSDLPLHLPAKCAPSEHVQHLFVVRVATSERDILQATLRECGIGTDVHYPVPDHRQPAWAARYAATHLPVTEALAESVLSLPCYPELTDAEVDEVIAALHVAFDR